MDLIKVNYSKDNINKIYETIHKTNIRDLNKEMGWELPIDGPKTLSGLIVEYLEDIPDSNLSLRIAGYPIEVIEIKENMVKLVKVIPSKRTDC